MDGIRAQTGNDLLRGWGFLFVRGLATIGFGIVMWTCPGVSLRASVWLFDIYVIADGVLDGSAASSSSHYGECSAVSLLRGLVGISLVVTTFIKPIVTTFAFLFYFAFWAIAASVEAIAAAIRARGPRPEEMPLVMSGIASARVIVACVASTALGALSYPDPVTTELTALWVISVYVIGSGILFLMFALKVRRLRRGMIGLVGHRTL